MDIWLSILDFCRTWRRELIRYGVVLLLTVSALISGRWGAAAIVVGAGLAMLAYDRWGEPWRKRGEEFAKVKDKMHQMLWLLLAACMAAGCAAKPAYLGDADIISVGSRLEFWVFHDSSGWQKSNVYVAMLPRTMTGIEARRWAESAGARDAGLLWTHYYVIATPEELHSRPRRSPVYPRKNVHSTVP